MNDPRANYSYTVIKRAIEEIDDAGGRISLSELSQRINMTRAHFQLLFAKWAGISPKKYHQYLTLEYSKQLLKNHHFVSNAAHDVGLSSPSRLNNFFVTWEGYIPEEFDQKAKEIVIGYSWVDSPFGEALIMTTKRGICGISFSSEIGKDKALFDMMQRWPRAKFSKDSELALKAGFQIFRAISGTKLHVFGAPFQLKVWEALMHIPSGYVSTYSDVAAVIGKPKATRAVGTAIGKNPISWLIPCHRALSKSGGLGGYHWGLPLKRKMLAFESVHRDASL